jgi:hypothetical protein
MGHVLRFEDVVQLSFREQIFFEHEFVDAAVKLTNSLELRRSLTIFVGRRLIISVRASLLRCCNRQSEQVVGSGLPRPTPGIGTKVYFDCGLIIRTNLRTTRLSTTLPRRSASIQTIRLPTSIEVLPKAMRATTRPSAI